MQARSMILSPLVRLALALSLVLMAGGADAGPLEEARKHYQRGSKHFQAGDYRAAIREFAAADRKAPSPVLNYNIALCHDRLGESGEAIRRYRLYLKKVPNAQNRAEVEASIERLQASAAKVEPVKPAPTAKKARPPKAEPPRAEPPRAEPPEAEPPREDPDPESASRAGQPAPPQPETEGRAPARRISAPAYRGSDPGLRRVSAIDVADIRARYFGGAASSGGAADDFNPPPPPPRR